MYQTNAIESKKIYFFLFKFDFYLQEEFLRYCYLFDL